MNFIINERNKELGADTFLLDRYIALLYAIGEELILLNFFTYNKITKPENNGGTIAEQ